MNLKIERQVWKDGNLYFMPNIAVWFNENGIPVGKGHSADPVPFARKVNKPFRVKKRIIAKLKLSEDYREFDPLLCRNGGAYGYDTYAYLVELNGVKYFIIDSRSTCEVKTGYDYIESIPASEVDADFLLFREDGVQKDYVWVLKPYFSRMSFEKFKQKFLKS